jgi:hypothetical protein
MTLSLMPKDLPLPVEPGDRNGISNQSTAIDVPVRNGPDGIFPYDPWLNANLAKQADYSQPETSDYGEPAYGKGGSITAEWGGMPSPVNGFADIGGSTLQVRRLLHPWPTNEVTGRFNGPQQTAWEYAYTDPSSDYWSVIVGDV